MTRAELPVVPALECRGLTVTYGSTPVLHELDLTVGAAEAVALLGPSGCGKTTLLYTVAGFVQPDAGRISIAGRVVAAGRHSEPPERRGVGVVFQNYALWPHLSALDIVAYPLRRSGLPKDEARRRSMSLLDRLGIARLARSRPAQLSGGEQQRVGVARALAREAPLYLFDEPTAHLDTALRTVLQEELAEQRTALGAAVLYATHDVAEAFAVADRVALVRDGRIVQIASPQEVYERPVDLWAARLTGPAAVLEVCVAPDGAGSLVLRVADASVTGVSATGVLPVREGVAQVLVRPEWAGLGGPLPGRITSVRFRGSDTDYRLDTPAGTVEVRERGAPRAAVGDGTGWTLERTWVLVSPASSPDPSARPVR
jgi:ABC-type Fe3+/spermidine/putrescine transport system ATPase subunit